MRLSTLGIAFVLITTAAFGAETTTHSSPPSLGRMLAQMGESNDLTHEGPM
jgi:hypothetical protein